VTGYTTPWETIMEWEDQSATRRDGRADPATEPTVPQIALPKGGGAIRGIGEKFAANPVTGAGAFTFPIALSPGRLGFGPQLTLSYNSGRGNTAFGWGWSIDLPSITRKTDKGLPRYQDWENADVFILAGAEDLVPALVQVKGQWTVQSAIRSLYQEQYQVNRYRPRVEAGFARIERWASLADTTDVFWRTISADNVTSWYGLTSQDRVADPSDSSRIFEWLISRSYDDRGNAILYGYKTENSQGVDQSQCHERNRSDLTRSAQRYIKTISYGNRTPVAPDLTAASPTALPTDWCFTVVFDYGEHDLADPTMTDSAQPWICRADPFSTYRPTFEVRTYRLCRRVLSFHNFPTIPSVGDGRLVRSTGLAHASPPTADPTQPFYSYLLSLTQTGYGDGGPPGPATSFPPVAFSYTEALIDETVREVDADSLRNLPQGFGGPYWWVDLDGEGLSGVLTEQGDGWHYKANLSPANVVRVGETELTQPQFAALERVAELPSIAALGGSRQQLAPLSGDGQLSLVQFDGPAPGYFERTAEGSWQPYAPFTSMPITDWRDPNLRFVDLTGDGFPDVLIAEDTAFTWHESLSTLGFGPAQRAPMAHDEEKGPKLVFADGTETVFLADMSGDGLSDLVRLRVGEVCYWPNLGYGQFGTKVSLDGVGLFDRPDQFDARRVRLADIDGSGTIDILYFAAREIRVWFNQSGNALASVRSLRQFPTVDTVSSAQVLDLLGNGTACLVWSSPLPGAARSPFRYIDLMGGQKPHLLVGVVNNLGAETTIRYAPSTKFYVADKLAGTPWITRLPFPVHVVERLETLDRVGRNRFATSYAYHHGYYDGVEREFRGFARVDQWDTAKVTTLGTAAYQVEPANEYAASTVAPVLTTTWYHTGVYFEGGAISAALQAEYYQEADNFAASEAMLLDDTPLPNSLTLPDGSHTPYALSPEELREACRALHGSMLRREVYALDGGAAQSLPYQSTEQNFTIEVLQPQGPNSFGVFLPHPRESLTVDYERAQVMVNGTFLADPAHPAPGDHLAADPRVTHAVTLATDGYGNVLQSAQVAYGRRYSDPTLSAVDQTRQSAILATAAISSFTNAITTADANRVPKPAQADTFELLQLSPPPPAAGVTKVIDFATLTSHVAAASDGTHDIPFEDNPPTSLTAGEPYRRLIARARTLYRPDDLGQGDGNASALLRLASLESMALPGATYTLTLTSGLIPQVFNRGGVALLPTPASVLASLAADGGGYVDLDGDGSAWAPSTRVYYAPTAVTPAQESTQARAHFFLGRRFVDPFGAATVVDYDDPQDLMPAAVTDPVGNLVQALNDYRVLAPSLLTDANGNQTAARFDALGMLVGTAVMGKVGQGMGDSFGTFQADLNPLQIDAFFAAADPHNLVAGLLGTATTRVVYDVQRYWESSQANPADPNTWQPAYAATLSREIHESDLSPGAVSPIQITFSYSDGFGQEVQKKVGAEPGTTQDPRWVGTGWRILNNKGKPVRQYEPFFSALASGGHQFEFAAVSGVSAILCYDPLDRVVATVHPNQTYDKVVLGPWAQSQWDANDTVMIDDPTTDPDVGVYLARLPSADISPTWRVQRIGGALGPDEQTAAVKTQAHASTPTLAHFDTMGRTILSVSDNAGGVTYDTGVDLDIQGRERSTTDALGRQICAYVYDLKGARIGQASMEAGQRWTLNDALGKPIRGWDDRGHNRRTEYDAMRRPTGQFVQGTDAVNSDPRTLPNELCYALTVYGEGQINDQALNLRTRVFQQNDPSGRTQNSALDPATQQTEAYDFKGNLLRATRQFVVEVRTLTNWADAPPALTPANTTAASFDALNRVVTATTPDGAVAWPSYNARNLTQALGVTLAGAAAPTAFVTQSDFDAKGRRLSVTCGAAGTTTTYAYDPLTFRLTSLTTNRPGAAANRHIAQALSYAYDPVGNVTHIQDDADLQNTVFFRNRRVDPSANYTYDAIYRLIAASGREQLGLAEGGVLPPMPTSYNDAGRVGLILPGDGSAMGVYNEQFAYDAVGNFTNLTHRGSNPANPGWSRAYVYAEASLIDAAQVSNRLTSTTLSGSQAALEAYAYDPHGNMTAMPQLQAMKWDFLDQLLMTRRQAVNAADPDGVLHQGERTYFAYGADGKRARKSTLSTTGVLTKQRFYLGSWELYQEYDGQGNVTLERRTLSVMDGARRAALVDATTIDASAAAANLPSVSTRYQFDNNVGSACLELDETGAVVTYEEYYPFGGTSYQAGSSAAEASLKRYRYCGKERDDETGLSCHGVRYYATWLGRWTACDPAGQVDGPNLYLYCRANPCILTDPGGTQSAPTPQGSEPQIKYHPFPTMEERAATALGDYHLTIDPVPAPPYKPLDFSALYQAIYGFDPSKLPLPPFQPVPAPDYVYGPSLPPTAPSGPLSLRFGPFRVSSEGVRVGPLNYTFDSGLGLAKAEEPGVLLSRFLHSLYIGPKGDIDIVRGNFYDSLRETPSYLQDMMANRENAYTGIDAKGNPYLNFVINTLGVPTTQYDNRARSPALIPIYTIDPGVNIGAKIDFGGLYSKIFGPLDLRLTWSPAWGNNVIGLSPLYPETQGMIPGGDQLLQAIGHQPNAPAATYWGGSIRIPFK
jgi:RHS repeat-associated protein